MSWQGDQEDSWLSAQRLARKLTPIPRPISHAVTALWHEHLANQDRDAPEISPGSFRAVHNLTNTKVLHAPIYFAACELFPEKIDALQEDDASKAVLRVMGPGCFAVVLATVYFYRRIGKLSDSEHWQEVSQELAAFMELAYALSKVSPSLDAATGLMLGSIRHIAQGVLLVSDKDQFARYRNRWKGKCKASDEHERWNCDTAQIAASILWLLKIIENTYEVHEALQLENETAKLNEEYVLWRGTLEWLDTLWFAGKVPAPSEASNSLQIGKMDAIELMAQAVELRRDGSTFQWLHRRTRELDE